ncbi:MAG: hypothetical protein ACQEQV_05895 [Fibrobacterota bacterium]
MKAYHLLLLTVLLCTSCGTGGRAGTVDETETDVMATVRYASGDPAANIPVRIFTNRDSSGEYVDSTRTDDSGSYRINSLPSGYYAIWAEGDTAALYRQDILIDDTSSYTATDTLQKTRPMILPVVVQPQHDPRIAEGHILGTHIHNVVTPGSHFTARALPPGDYFIRFTATEAGYTPTTEMISLRHDSPDTLRDTLTLAYTGIPVVKNITAAYDTLAGTAEISWSSAEYAHGETYLIYRDSIHAAELGASPIGSSDDTVWTDHFTDTPPAGTYVYRVRLRSFTGEQGENFFRDTINYVPPEEELNVIRPESLSTNIHRPLRLPLHLPAVLGDSLRLELSGASLDTIRMDADDTITLPCSTAYMKSALIHARLSAPHGPSVTDSFRLSVSPVWEKRADPPAPGARYLPLTATDNALILPILRKDSLSLLRSTDGVAFSQHAGTPFTTDSIHEPSNGVFHDGRLWIADAQGGLHSSADEGLTWQQETTGGARPAWTGVKERKFCLSHEGTLFLLIEQSDDTLHIGGTLFSLYQYDPGSDTLVSIDEQRIRLHSYWLDRTGDTPTLITHNAKSLTGELTTYHIGGNGMSPGTTVTTNITDSEHLPWESQPYLPGITDHNGRYLMHGGGADRDLLILMDTESTEQDFFDLREKSIRLSALKNRECYRFQGRLFALTEGGIYTNAAP